MSRSLLTQMAVYNFLGQVRGLGYDGSAGQGAHYRSVDGNRTIRYAASWSSVRDIWSSPCCVPVGRAVRYDDIAKLGVLE